jgi:hypothetical protein
MHAARLVPAGMSPGSSIPTTPCTAAQTTLRAPKIRTMRPRLSDVFTAQAPDIPVPNVDPGLVPMSSATLGPAPAGPSATLGVDFIQINCGKRISAMALLETNVQNKMALIQEPYTSVNGCTLLHKRDFFSSSLVPPSTIPMGTVPALSTTWTSLRPRAAIYAPGPSDVLPVYIFMTRDIATVAVQLGFILSVYMDIRKSVRSPELIALLDFCRQEQKTLLMSIDCNAHSYLLSDCENNCGLEIDGLIAEYGLEIHNRGITPTFAGTGPNNTVNYSVVDITLSMNMPSNHKIKEWKVSDIPSGSDHRNITFGYRAGGHASKKTKLGCNYHKADWDRFRTMVNTSKMKNIAKRQMWTELLIEEMTKQWYASVDKAFNKVCPLKKIKVKEKEDWWDEDCKVVRQQYRSKYKSAHRGG